jgi:predicted RNase H-like nuclease (RuvC/YqgF family)
MMLGYEGMSAEMLREMIRARFRIEDCVLPWGEQPVDESWANDWRIIGLPIRGGRREETEEEEEPDDSEESEEEDTDPETQSVEETRELLERLEEEARMLNCMVARYGEEAIRIQDQLDEVRDQRREADDPGLRDDMRALRTILRDVTAKLRRTRRHRTQLEERCERERKGLEEAPAGWVMSKLRMWGEGHWVMLRPGEA